MSIQSFAKALGRKGGLARAKRLSAEKRKSIASLGGRARSESFEIARRIKENFRYVSAVQALAGVPKVRSLKTARNQLPGTYG